MDPEEYDPSIISFMGNLCGLGKICTLDDIKKKTHDNPVIIGSIRVMLPFRAKSPAQSHDTLVYHLKEIFTAGKYTRKKFKVIFLGDAATLVRDCHLRMKDTMAFHMPKLAHDGSYKRNLEFSRYSFVIGRWPQGNPEGMYFKKKNTTDDWKRIDLNPRNDVADLQNPTVNVLRCDDTGCKVENSSSQRATKRKLSGDSVFAEKEVYTNGEIEQTFSSINHAADQENSQEPRPSKKQLLEDPKADESPPVANEECDKRNIPQDLANEKRDERNILQDLVNEKRDERNILQDLVNEERDERSIPQDSSSVESIDEFSIFKNRETILSQNIDKFSCSSEVTNPKKVEQPALKEPTRLEVNEPTSSKNNMILSEPSNKSLSPSNEELNDLAEEDNPYHLEPMNEFTSPESYKAPSELSVNKPLSSSPSNDVDTDYASPSGEELFNPKNVNELVSPENYEVPRELTVNKPLSSPSNDENTHHAGAFVEELSNPKNVNELVSPENCEVLQDEQSPVAHETIDHENLNQISTRGHGQELSRESVDNVDPSDGENRTEILTSWPKPKRGDMFTITTRLVETDPAIDGNDEVILKLIRRFCDRCHHFILSNCELLIEGEASIPICPRCRKDGKIQNLSFRFAFYLLLEDEEGLVTAVLLMNRIAENFLGCTVSDFQKSAEARKKVIDFLLSCTCLEGEENKTLTVKIVPAKDNIGKWQYCAAEVQIARA